MAKSSVSASRRLLRPAWEKCARKDDARGEQQRGDGSDLACDGVPRAGRDAARRPPHDEIPLACPSRGLSGRESNIAVLKVRPRRRTGGKRREGPSLTWGAALREVEQCRDRGGPVLDIPGSTLGRIIGVRLPCRGAYSVFRSALNPPWSLGGSGLLSRQGAPQALRMALIAGKIARPAGE